MPDIACFGTYRSTADICGRCEHRVTCEARASGRRLAAVASCPGTFDARASACRSCVLVAGCSARPKRCACGSVRKTQRVVPETLPDGSLVFRPSSLVDVCARCGVPW